MRRVLIITDDSKPRLGGVAEYLHQLATAIAGTYEVEVVTAEPGAEGCNDGLSFRYREVPWLRRHELHWPGDSIPMVRRLNSVFWRAGLRRRMRQRLAALMAERPATTVVIGRLCWETSPWMNACIDLGVPYLAIAHGLELLEPLSPARDEERRTQVQSAAHWFANSDDTVRILHTFGVAPSHVSVLRPAVVIPYDENDDDARERVRLTRQRFDLCDRPYVLSLARLVPRKGIDLAIGGFAAVAREFPDVVLVVAGEGPQEGALRRLAEQSGITDRVRFVGPVDDATKAALFAGCEAYVMPNRVLPNDVEGFGIVFLEAAAYGKPAVGGANGGVPDAVISENTGLLVDTARGADAVGEALARLLADPALRRSLGDRARERVQRDFAWADRAAAFARAIDHVS
jgi:phosphatidyl-myo-inositol dimannoside synthase